MSRASLPIYLTSSGIHRTSHTSSNSSQQTLAGVLLQRDANGKVETKRKVFTNKEFIIGRDRSKCQLVINDSTISKKHLRIYSVVYDNNNPSEVDILVYAEDLSRNGTYWNGSLIGRGNGGFLLSQDDKLKLAPNVFLDFQMSVYSATAEHFDAVQEIEMAKFRHSYILTDRLLGSGAFGRVFMAVEQTARRQLACKTVDLRKLRPSIPIGRLEQPAAAENVDSRIQMRKLRDWIDKQKRGNKLDDKLKVYSREVEILNSIRHPNIIGLEKVYVTDNTMYMFQDLVTGGDLFSYIESKNGKLLEVEAAVIVLQIVIALSYLHDKNIVHRDLKPDNILMTSSSAGCRVILTDFGAARRIDHSRHRMTSLVGTDEYAAPEVLYDKPSLARSAKVGYTKSVDVWALGCVTVVLLTGGSAFLDPSTGTYSEKLAHACDLGFLRQSSDWQQVGSRPKSFVERLLVLDEDNRMTARQAMHHEWFSNEVHKTNFEEWYQRTIKHWRPRPPKREIVEFQNATFVRSLIFSRQFTFDRKSRTRSEDPIDAHCKPVPKKMYSTLWPRKRRGSPFASEEIREAIRNSRHSGWKDRNLFDGDDEEDDGESESLSQKLKRRGLLSSSQTSPESPLNRGRRSSSAPPRPANSHYFQPKQQQNGNTVRKSPAVSHSTHDIPKANVEKRAVQFLDKQLLNQTVASPRGPAIGHNDGSKPAGRYHSSSAPASDDESPRPARRKQLALRPSNDGILDQTTSTSFAPFPRGLDQPQLDNKTHKMASPVQSCDFSKPIRTDRLKRWFSSPLQGSISSRSSSKRRRNSIFDIEEDEDIERSPLHEQEKKRMKKADVVREWCDPKLDSDDASSGDEITLPHQPPRLRATETTSAASSLYLPR